MNRRHPSRLAVHPDLRETLDALRRAPRLSEMTLEDLRASRRHPAPGPVPEVDRVEDRSLPGPAGDVPVRIYHPGGQNLPVLVFLHGGGFVCGGLGGYYDLLCRRLARRTCRAVVAVDYRLAPEHPFPAAGEDCHAVRSWLIAHGAEIGVDGTAISLFGISAGGALAAATALSARDADAPPLREMVLFYPVLDYHTPARPSYATFGEDYYLTRADMIWFWDQYLGDPARADDPRAAPLRADTLTGMPRTLVVAAESDPLRDEAREFHDRLIRDGVPADLLLCEGMIHGFLAFPLPRVAAIVDRAMTWLLAPPVAAHGESRI